MNDALRKRLAAAAYISIDAELMTQIHDRLMAATGKISIPLTVKYKFDRDEEGELSVSTSVSSTLPGATVRLRLESNGKQLELFTTAGVDPKEAPVEKAPPDERPQPALGTQENKLAAIRKENEHLYRTGQINRAMAMRAGVPVDEIDSGPA
jgi:hypothetical protein